MRTTDGLPKFHVLDIVCVLTVMAPELAAANAF